MSPSLTRLPVQCSGGHTTVVPCATAQSNETAIYSESGHSSTGLTINSSGLINRKETTKLVASDIENPKPDPEAPTPQPGNAGTNSSSGVITPAVVVPREVEVQARVKHSLVQLDQRLAKTDFALGAGLVVGRTFDFVTTNECLRRPSYWCHEAELPNAIVRNQPAFALFEGGMTALALYGQHVLIAHGHRKLSRLILGSEDSWSITADLHNWQIAK